MSPRRKESTARRATYSRVEYRPGVLPFAKSLDGQPPFEADIVFLRESSHASNAERFEALLASVQAVERLKPLEVPAYEAVVLDKAEDLSEARMQLEEIVGNAEPSEWDEARVWRELYEQTFAKAESLQNTGSKLEEKLEEGIGDLDDHNNVLDSISHEARRLQLDLNL